MLVWLGQAVNSSVPLRRAKKTADFLNAIMASPSCFSLGRVVIITLSIANCRLPICALNREIIGNGQWEMGNRKWALDNHLNQPIGRPERSTQTLFTCVYSS